MTEIVIAVAGKVAEYLVAPIGRQLGYLFCYRTLTDDLRNKVQTLGTARADLQITIDEATRRGDQIRPIVEDWLKQVDEITGEAETILMKKKDDEKKNNKKMISSCFNLMSRYQLGREAYKKAQVIADIQAAGDFPADGVSYHVPPRSVTFKEYECFESRASTLNKIMDALRDDDKKTNIIGVWGMGGVGKTTLVKQVAEQAKQEKLFITQVYVQVSWTREPEKFQQGISDIQQHIADMLGLEFKNEAQSTKAAKLTQRLKNEKILIILDDIWKEVKLEEVGIPSCKDDDQKNCKIVMTSRDKDLLCKYMGAQECFPIQHLQEKEAWHLFKKTAGDSLQNNLELQRTAREVVKECQGLPVAIVTITKALKDESVAVWKNALHELRISAPTNIREVDDKVYGCLEWSYNHLKGDEVKSLFLLCGLLPYGDISLDQLLKYAVSLDLFDHIQSLEQARNKLVTLVTTLKASSLLLEGENRRQYYFRRPGSTLLFMDADDNKFIRMHDVVRDVAKNIAASKDPHRFVVREYVPLEDDCSETDDSKCKVVHELPHKPISPKLQIFLLQNNNTPSLNQLKALDLSRTTFETLPSTLQSLVNLRTLCLDWCYMLRDISGIGELKKLRVLSMVGSDIRQLPQEMVQLTDLRLLDLNGCEKLRVIPRNILSKLSRLECLFMKSIRFLWAAEEVSSEESKVCLSELNHLPHLIALEVEILDVKSVPKEDKFFQNLTTYAISIGIFSLVNRKEYKTSKRLCFENGDGSLLSRDGIRKLLKKTEELQLKRLEELGRGPILRSLDSLKFLKVRQCYGLKMLFCISLAGGLPQLESMAIRDCKEMQSLVTYERESEIKEDDINLQPFPKLRSLKLHSLPELTNFDYFSSDWETSSQGMCSQQANLHIHLPFFSDQVPFSNLEMLQLYELPKLKKIWHHQHPPDSFSNLGILRVKDCPCLLNLIPCTLTQSFKILKEIEVRNCKLLEYIFYLQGYDDTNVEILPKLESLKLENLVGLKGIICNNEKNDSTRGFFYPYLPVSFHNLRCLSINCSKKEDNNEGNVNIPTEDRVLFGEKVSFPNLEELKLSGLSMLKMIWHPQLSLKSFHKLQILNVYTCPSLVNLIPSHLIQSLQNLKEVIVHDCKVLEHVFDHGEVCDGDNRILPRMEVLKLEILPKLKLIFCNKDKNDNMRYLLSPFMFKDFHHLKDLRIIHCGMPLDEKVSFPPNLEALVLKSFSKLKEIDFGSSPKLKFLTLEKLPNLGRIISNEDENASMGCLLSPSSFKNFHNLDKLCIEVLPNKKLGGVSCNYEAFESRDSTLNKIMEALRDDNINLIGVVGIGGVGKTTLVKQVAQQAEEQQLFAKQVYIDLSWIRHSSKLGEGIDEIQGRIAEIIGCEFEWHCCDRSRRAAKLKQRLKKQKEKILIILDHIWKEIDLDEIGIPIINSSRKEDDGDVKKCKIVLISCTRDGDGAGECKEKCYMGAQICIRVDALPPEEAWTLFNETAGPENIPEEVRSTAYQVVEECCDGLPIAIVPIAKALKDETQPAVWKNALEHLRGVPNKVYSCLEWCYTTHLKDDDLKSLFLLCGSLSYGYGDISMNLLLQYAIGLELFGRFETLEQARNRLLALVEFLRASSQLLEVREYRQNFRGITSSLTSTDLYNKFVRMHDVAYDVARDIASNHHHHPFVVIRDDDAVGLEEWSKSDESNRCTFISLYCKEVHKLPQGLVFPELQTLLLHNNYHRLKNPNKFFQGMKNLQVLDLSGTSFEKLFSSLDSLANLRTLRLNDCYNLRDIALIGKLTKLEVLSLVGSIIQRLPHEMVQLTNLRLLDLNNCRSLEVIPKNILSSLSRLECLFMGDSFTEWAVEGESNACLSELSHLSHLTNLSIKIPDAELLPKDILFDNLKRYAILVGGLWRLRKDRTLKRYEILVGGSWGLRTDRTLRFYLVNRSLHLGDGMSKLLERSEEVEFERLSGTNYVLYPSNGDSFLELKHLRVADSPEIQYIIDSMDQRMFLQHGAFPMLASLVLWNMDNLQEVWHGSIPIGSFRNLKTLEVVSCPELRYLFSLSMARGLFQLDSMKIERCKAMQQIIAYERKSEDRYVGTNLELFPSLRTLILQSLPQLINISSELETSSSTCLSSNARSEDSFFNHNKVSYSLSNLEKLELHDLPKFKDIWSLQRPYRSFCNLRILEVYKCPNLFNLVA